MVNLSAIFQNFQPQFVFIESSCPAFLSTYSDGSLFIYTKNAFKYSLTGQNTLVVPFFLMRYLKIVCALCFPCTFSGGFGIAYRISRSKSIISDGILTEWLYKEGHIKPRKFISIANVKPSLPVDEESQLILGNNMYEFGVLSYQRNHDYLRMLRKNYPDAYYYPHPKEGRDLLREVFGTKLIDSSDNIEAYCRKNGVPGHLIGFLGSTAMASLGKLAKSSITIDAIKIHAGDCDGPQGEITDPLLLHKKGIKVTMSGLEEVVVGILADDSSVKINVKQITFGA